MRSFLLEFENLQDLQDTLKRMNITDVITAPDNELLVQVSVDQAQYLELRRLDYVTIVDEM